MPPTLTFIPPGEARAFSVPKGGLIRIINSEGNQVVDTWAFNSSSPSEFLSMAHSRSALYRLFFEPGDTLVSNRFQPILTINKDTSPGYHDTLHAACSAESNRYYGAEHQYPNCQDNLKTIIHSREMPLQTTPCPWNLFERAIVLPDGTLKDEPSLAATGDYLELSAEVDLVLVCSACPSLIGNISSGQPRGATIEIADYR
ncbi:MAG TPA: urea carboxylase-associated family protein [Gammaproteobacteria bacterium]|nr:urea carboxylase-associated family protein [Gammaproteobacteria bacterium]HIM05072.1 urea carboxylase-associated family protein [Gammaproteobacteria bacterium]